MDQRKRSSYTGPGTAPGRQTSNSTPEPETDPTNYPKWKYHKTLPAKIVDSAEQEVALGDEWKDSPAHLDKWKTEPDVARE